MMCVADKKSHVGYISHFEGYLNEKAKDLFGYHVAVQTTRNVLTGKIASVTPDHIVLDVKGVPFYIRVQQIVWISPTIAK